MGSIPRAPASVLARPWRRELVVSHRLELLARALVGLSVRMGGTATAPLPPRRPRTRPGRATRSA
jgi:hypothetical protein